MPGRHLPRTTRLKLRHGVKVSVHRGWPPGRVPAESRAPDDPKRSG